MEGTLSSGYLSRSFFRVPDVRRDSDPGKQERMAADTLSISEGPQRTIALSEKLVMTRRSGISASRPCRAERTSVLPVSGGTVNTT